MLTYLGGQRKIGGYTSFFLALFLTPFIAIPVILLSAKNTRIIRQQKQYKCHRCKLRYTEKLEYCPSCMKDGYKIKLKPLIMDFI